MIVLVFGLPGTGKTYFSAHLANDIGAIHLSTDIIRTKMNKTEEYDENTKQYIYDKLKLEMIINLKNGNDVIVEGTFYDNEKRIQFIKAAAALQSPIKFIEIKAEETLIRDRLNQDRAQSEANFKVYQKIKRIFEPFEKQHLELWSYQDNISEMKQEAKKYIYG
jgi:predicted kinase